MAYNVCYIFADLFYFILIICIDEFSWEFDDHLEFKGNDGASKTILVKEDISFMAFLDKIYAKLGLSRDMFELSLIFLPQMIQKSQPVFIKANDDVAMLLASWDEMT